jgi:RHS repeat-associated protein
MKRILFGLFCVIVFGTATALSFRPDSFEIFYGDVNGDGYDDIYLKAREKIVILGFTILTPVTYTDSPSYLLLGNDDGSFGWPNEWSQYVDTSLMTEGGYTVYLADIDGDGVDDLLLQSDSVSRNSIILYAGDGRFIKSSYSFSTISGEYVSSDYSSWTLKDVNGDGKVDIILNAGTGQQKVGVSEGITGLYDEQYGTPDYVTASNRIVVGASPGEIDVSGSSGAVSYSMPISVPVGAGGISPQLSIEYSNMGGDSGLGKGFHMTGISKITRCPTSNAIEGFIEAPLSGNNYAFCMDGQRLVSVNAGNTEYRLQIDSIAKIKAIGNARNPSFFEVYYKSGEKEIFGDQSRYARVVYSGNVLEWYVSRRQDKVGNGYDINYQEQDDDRNGEVLVESIVYRNTSGVGNSENVRIDFSYANRSSDSDRVLYQSGRPFYRDTILSSIISSVSGNVFRSYYFTYESSTVTNQIRLVKSQECGADNTCLEPTVFGWNNFSGKLEFSSSVSVNTGICPNGERNSITGKCDGAGHYNSFSYPDINGDGYQDVCYRSSSGVVCYLNESGVRFSSSPIVTNICGNGDRTEGCNDSDNHDTIRYLDFNHDGKDDLLFRADNGLVVYTSTGNGFGSRPAASFDNVCHGGSDCLTRNDNKGTYLFTPDLNADGFLDFCWVNDVLELKCILSDYSYFKEDYSEPFVFKKLNGFDLQVIQFPDVDGDGDQDLLLRSDSNSSSVGHKGLAVYVLDMSNGTPSAKIFEITDECGGSSAMSDCNGDISYDVTVGNVNGDAYDDICFRAKGGVRCLISTGIGFRTIDTYGVLTDEYGQLGFCGDRGSRTRNPYECYRDRSNGLMLVDINGDGKDDLFYRGFNGFHIIYSTGSSFVDSGINLNICGDNEADADCKSNDNNFGTVSLLDFNGDGYSDLVYRNDSGLKIHLAAARTKNYLVDTVASITNGHGLKHSIEYSTLMDSAVYGSSRGEYSSTTHKQILGRVGMPVVKSVRSTTANNTEAVNTYFYSDYTQERYPLGGSSFGQSTVIKTYSDGKGVKTVSNYHTNFPFSGSAKDTTGYHLGVRRNWIKDDSNVTVWGLRRWRSDKGDIYSITNNMALVYEYFDGNLIKFTRSINYFNGESVHGNAHSGDKFNDVTKQVTDVFAMPAAWTGDYTNDSEIYLTTSRDWDNDEDDIAYQFDDKPHVSVKTTSVYDAPNTSSWILGRLLKTTVTKTDWDGKSKSMSSEWTYYSNGLLKTETYAPATEFEKTTEYVYNGQGQQTSVTVTPVTGKSSKSTYQYLDGYLYRSTNALGFSNYVIRHSVLGLPETTIDENGFITTYEYDGFGRQTRVISPGGMISETTLATTPKHFSGTRYTETTTTNTGGFSRVYFDKAGFRLGVASKGADGVVRYQKYEDNELGMLVRSYMPSTSVSSATADAGIDNIDQNFRVTRSHDARGNISSVEYHPYHKIVTNPKGQTKTEYVRPDGKTVKVVQGLDYVITYDYDVDGNLIHTTSEGITITNTYDKAGRRTSIDDPDKGKWLYVYNALGQQVLQQSAKGYKTCYAYDVIGRTVARYDEYKGSSADARNDCAANDGARVTQWTYDTAKLGQYSSIYKGALASVVNADGYRETYLYDNQGRVVRVDRNVKGTVYSEINDYDQFSRLFSHTYPSGLRTRNYYNSVGTLTRITNYSSGFTYWQIAGFDALGRVNKNRLGNGLYEHTLFAETHSAIDRQVVSASSTMPANYSDSQDRLWLEYEYDELDNYSKRVDKSLGLTETFGFDNLNRMQTSILKHGSKTIVSEEMQYQRNGNIESKPGTGRYQYGEVCAVPGVSGTRQAGPHAVSSVTLDEQVSHYCYDRNGNMIADAKRRLYYATTYDKPLKITHTSGASVEFAYDQDRGRYYRRDVEQGKITETFFAASGYEKVVKNVGELDQSFVEKHYIAGSVVEIYTNGNSSVPERRYMHKDNLGSVVMITDAKGKVIERHNFDPWGEKRDLAGMRIPEYLQLEASARFGTEQYYTYKGLVNDDKYPDLYVQSAPDWVLIAQSPAFLVPTYGKAWVYFGKADGSYQAPVEWFNGLNVSKMTVVADAPLRNTTTLMGFTGHEQLESVGIVHMGGRLYDPKLGRMLNADPFVQAPANSQSFNRYSYVMNNPVSLVDPSGYLWNPVRSLTKAVSKLGSYIGSRGTKLDDWQRQYTDQFGAWFREKAASNPRTFALLQAAGCAITAAPTGGMGCVAIQGISSGIITKDFKAGLKTAAIAAATVGASYGIGELAKVGSITGAERVGLHMLVGGASSRASGGSFWRGAASSFAANTLPGKMVEMAPQSWHSAMNGAMGHAMMGAMVGGTTAVITGGGTQGFVNGAMTGAMQQLFNHWAHEDAQEGQSFWDNPGAHLPSLPQGLVDFSAGFGDTLSFGLTDSLRDLMGTNGVVNSDSGAYLSGEIAGIAHTTLLGGAAGLRAAGSAGRGLEFSHWIPNRMGGPRSLFNGNFVTREFHALSDPFRYRFMPRTWKALNPMPSSAVQQWNRIPYVWKGAGAGLGYGTASAIGD